MQIAQNMTSLAFLYVMLPASVAVFLLCPPVWRSKALLGISLGVCLLIRPDYFWLMPLCAGLDWAAIRLMGVLDSSPAARRALVAFSAVKSLLLIVAFDFLLPSGSGEAPWGLRIYAVSSLGCVIEAYRRQISCNVSPASFALYCGFFPRLDAGPLIPYRDFSAQLRELNPSGREMLAGLGMFVQGGVKALVLGESLLTLYDSLRAFPADEITVAGIWFSLLALALSLYYRLSGIAVMAQGIGRMTGIRLPQNFYFPYQSRSVTDFFERFNITVSRFIRQNVYEPLGGEKNGRLADCLNLLVTGALMGLWLGPRLNCIIWGLCLGMLTVLEKHAAAGIIRRVPTFFMRMYTFCAVLSGFAVLGGESVRESGEAITGMFGLDGLKLINDRLVYLLSSNWLLLAVSLLFATSGVSLLLGFLQKRLPRLTAVMLGAVNVFLLILLSVFAI